MNLDEQMDGYARQQEWVMAELNRLALTPPAAKRRPEWSARLAELQGRQRNLAREFDRFLVRHTAPS